MYKFIIYPDMFLHLPGSHACIHSCTHLDSTCFHLSSWC